MKGSLNTRLPFFIFIPRNLVLRASRRSRYAGVRDDWLCRLPVRHGPFFETARRGGACPAFWGAASGAPTPELREPSNRRSRRSLVEFFIPATPHSDPTLRAGPRFLFEIGLRKREHAILDAERFADVGHPYGVPSSMPGPLGPDSLLPYEMQAASTFVLNPEKTGVGMAEKQILFCEGVS